MISEWLIGFVAGVVAAFGCSAIISVVLMMVVDFKAIDFDKPGPVD